MSKTPKKPIPQSGEADWPSEPSRGPSGGIEQSKFAVSGMKGFEEAPQAAFEGVPYSGSVTDWVRELEQQAAKESRKADTREIRSKAGTHRVTVERKAQDAIPVDPNDVERAAILKKLGENKKAKASIILVSCRLILFRQW